MTGALLVAAALLTAFLAAASLRLPGLVATFVASYVLYVADVTFSVLVLSPFRAVDRFGIGCVQAILLLAATGCWLLRGRPRPRLTQARGALRQIAFDPAALGFVLLVVAALAYELTLVLTVPANDYDGLAYHLARAAEWTQHRGYFWIPNSPDDRLNEFQPIAEQQILFYFATLGKGVLFALPQFLAEVAILGTVYGAARRLGYEVRSAVCAAGLLATFGLVGLEASTAQNDLVAASFPLAAAYLFLGESSVEVALGGVAVAIALGVKLTSALTLPVLVLLLLARGRRRLLTGLAGAVIGFVMLAMWGFVLNLVHTGHVLGYGGGRTENEASPAYPASLITALYVLYTMMDLSALSNHLIKVLEIVGVAAAVVTAAAGFARRRPFGRALVGGGRVGIPFLAPLIVIGGGGVLAWITRQLGYPARGAGGTVGPLTRSVNSGSSAFGPLGAVALYGVSVLTLAGYRRHRSDPRALALALALPVFLVLLALQSKWNAFLPRFFVVPVALTGPLLARLVRSRLVSIAYLLVAATVLWVTLTNDQVKPLSSPYGRPWQLTPVTAIATADPQDASMLAAYDRVVPEPSCVAAILGRNEPVYLLFGPNLGRDVVFLADPTLASGEQVLQNAYHSGASYVVISTALPNAMPGSPNSLSDTFSSAGWRIRSLGGNWLLATAPHVVAGGCPS